MDDRQDELRARLAKKRLLIDTAAGRVRAPLVLKNAVYVNVFSRELCRGDIALCGGVIAGIGCYNGQTERDMEGRIVCPGLIDAHIHLESSLVCPAEFANAVVPHGTTAVVTDPHEIANVMGVSGIEAMLMATQDLPLDVFFMLPSCVPSTPLDEAGAALDWAAIDRLYDHPRVLGLAEMMNAFGVTAGDEAVLEKLCAAQRRGKLMDGHAPGLSGCALNAYIAAGVYSDHECADPAEALEKLRRGQYIMLRDGTAARNLEALVPLISDQTEAQCLFCTDDKHPSDLLEKGHIDYIIRRAAALGVDPILAVKIATLNAARYFRLYDRGAVAPGYRADLTVIDDLEHFRVLSVYQNGHLRFDGAMTEAAPVPDNRLFAAARDTFHLPHLSAADFPDGESRGVIGLVPGQIITTANGRADRAAPDADILKLAVVERHKSTGHIGLGYLHGYGLRHGAVATSISHDSHNIIVVGATAEDMAFAAQRVADNRGGIVVADRGKILAEVVLEVAGLMSQAPLAEVNQVLEQAKTAAHSLGVFSQIDPFMTLSFLSLPVIPALRLTTRGMVDVATQQYI